MVCQEPAKKAKSFANVLSIVRLVIARLTGKLWAAIKLLGSKRSSRIVIPAREQAKTEKSTAGGEVLRCISGKNITTF